MILVLAVAVSAMGRTTQGPAETFRKATLAWLTKSGYKADFAKPLVQVTVRPEGNARKADELDQDTCGFLLRKTRKDIEVLGLDLQHWFFDLKDNGLPVIVKAISARGAIDWELKQIDPASEPSYEPVGASFLAQLVGDAASSRKLFAYAMTSTSLKPDLTLFKADLGAMEFRAINECIFENNAGWPAIQARLNAFVKRFPSDEFARTYARDYLNELNRMSKLRSPSNRAERLVFGLRNEISDVEDFPSYDTGPFSTPAHPKKPGDLLYAMKWKAVPALIKGLTDTSLTHHATPPEFAGTNDRYRIYSTDRVGDVASGILRMIVHKSFFDEADSNLSWIETQKAIQKRARAWWNANHSSMMSISLDLQGPFALPPVCACDHKP